MTEKDISLKCFDCESTFIVTKHRARRGECPNCHEVNTRVLDEIE